MKSRLKREHEPKTEKVSLIDGLQIYEEAGLYCTERKIRVQSDDLDIVVYGVIGEVGGFVNTLKAVTRTVSNQEEVRLTDTRIDFPLELYDVQELVVLMKYAPTECQRGAALTEFHSRFPSHEKRITFGVQAIQRT